MKWAPTLPDKGDIIRVKHRFYYHYGVYIDDSNIVQFGLAEDAVGKAEDIRVLSSNVSEFAKGGEVECAVLSKAEKTKRKSPEEICAYATAHIGEGDYNILHNNCEHFAYRCVFGENTAPGMDSIRDKIRNKLKR